MKDTIRTAIKRAVSDIRETRANRRTPCLMGYGWTIAIKGTTLSISQCEKGYQFMGMWNRHSIYWKQETALAGMREIKDSTALELEVIHYNQLRDRHEETQMSLLKSFFPIRNKV